MNTGLSFNLALLAMIVVFVAIGLAIANALRRMDELEEQHERRRHAAAAMGLPSSQPPPCVRELDPNGPFDWARMGER